MEILLVAATPFEIAPTLTFLEKTFTTVKEGVFAKKGVQIRALVTGVGSVATAWHLGRDLARHTPNWVIHAGVAGAFDHLLTLGTVVQVKSERFADLGVEEADGRFTDLFELGLCLPNEHPYVNGRLYNPAAEQALFLPVAEGLTVNRVHGYAANIDAIRTKYPEAQVESMEGAAFFYACLMAGIPFTAVRSISNYVEPRNRDAWELGLAIEQLNIVVVAMLDSITPRVQ